MENLPIYIPMVFAATVAAAVWLFYRAAGGAKAVLFVVLPWLALQTVVSLSGFYQATSAVPPRFPLLVLPALALILLLFSTAWGRRFLDSLDLKALTLLHLVRVPVELVLFWLFLQKAVPGLMTFEGRNFDIISGLSAPLVYYFAFVKRLLGPAALITWNLLCLGLLANIVFHAVFSLQSPFQKFAFDQPNIAVLHFPFVWLPCCVVPIVLIAHLASLRQLWLRPTSL